MLNMLSSLNKDIIIIIIIIIIWVFAGRTCNPVANWWARLNVYMWYGGILQY